MNLHAVKCSHYFPLDKKLEFSSDDQKFAPELIFSDFKILTFCPIFAIQLQPP